jgi:hypothetical protein
MNTRNTHPTLHILSHPRNMRHRHPCRHQLHLDPTLSPHRHRPREHHRKRPAYGTVVQKPLGSRNVYYGRCHAFEDRPQYRLPPALHR